MGGGVVLDLLHEVDLAYYLFGDFPSALVASNKLSHLEIDVDDTAAVLLNRNFGPLVTVNMDYVARKPIRCFKIVGDKATLFCDIFNKKLVIESQNSEEYLDLNKSFYDVNATYTRALKEFLSSISKKIPSAYPLREAIQMHQLILEQIQK